MFGKKNIGNVSEPELVNLDLVCTMRRLLPGERRDGREAQSPHPTILIWYPAVEKIAMAKVTDSEDCAILLNPSKVSVKPVS